MTGQNVSRLSALRHCISYPQDFSLFWGKNGVFRKRTTVGKLCLDEARHHVDEIVSFYSELIASGNNALSYLYFEVAYGISEYRGGYLIQQEWAEGAIDAARHNKEVFNRLSAVVSVNLQLGIAMPPILLVFASQVVDQTFVCPNKRGPDADKTALRDYAIHECLQLLCNRYGMQLETTGEKRKITAEQVIRDAFQNADFGVDANVAKPTLRAIKEVRVGKKFANIDAEVASFRYSLRHQEHNTWFKTFWLRKLETKIKNYLCTCFHWLG